MVAAGVYLVARMFEVFVRRRPVRAAGGRASIGAITLLLAAFLALVQDDIKKVLAYSTISQLAYMVAALGLGEAGYAPACSTCSPTRSSRRCCSWAPAR